MACARKKRLSGHFHDRRVRIHAVVCHSIDLPEGAKASAHHLASWKFAEPKTWLTPQMLLGEVRDDIDNLHVPPRPLSYRHARQGSCSHSHKIGIFRLGIQAAQRGVRRGRPRGY